MPTINRRSGRITPTTAENRANNTKRGQARVKAGSAAFGNAMGFLGKGIAARMGKQLGSQRAAAAALGSARPKTKVRAIQRGARKGQIVMGGGG